MQNLRASTQSRGRRTLERDAAYEERMNVMKTLVFPGSAALCALLITAPASAQARGTGGARPPLVGTVSPRAIGRPAPTPAPIGGLRTRPLNSPSMDSRRPIGADPSRFRDRNGRDGRYRDRDRYRNGYGDERRHPEFRRVPDAYGHYSPLGVGDAPLIRGGGITVQINPGAFNDRDRTGAYNLRTWYPAPNRPRWRIDTRLSPVQAWRDLIVTDVVCDGNGTCMEREQRARAPWVATCRCYMFTDALGRRWEVE